MEISENEKKVLMSIYYNKHFGSRPGGFIWLDSINDSAKPSGIHGKSLSNAVISLTSKNLLSPSPSMGNMLVRINPNGINCVREINKE